MTAPAPFRDERGSALPVVVGVLLTIGILATVLLNTSVELRHSTSQGRQAKQAFAAANAGLAVAKYRLNKLVPPTDKCLTDRPVSAGTGGAVAGQCPGRTEMLGDGASYTYYVSQALPSGTSQCTVPSGTDVTTKDWRCITSVGSVAGEKRRVQALVASLRSAGKFAVNGVLALSSMKQSGTANITGDVAGNGKMEFAGPPLPARVLLGPSGTVKPTSIPVTYQAADYTAQTYDAEFAASAASNDNASLSPLPTNVTLNAFRELAATNTVGTPSSPWVLPSGTYNFCDFSFGNKTYIQLAPGARVHIYIDSPNRPGSGCRTGTGDITATNTFNMTNPSGDPEALQFDVYGGAGTAVKMSNQNTLTGTIYAPASDFVSTGVGTFVGGIVARTIATSNTFNFTAAVPSSLLNGSAGYDASGWGECMRTPPDSTVPSSGC